MEKIRVVLPRKYDLVVGDTFQLFFRGVVEAPDPFHYDILALCEVGRNCPRYFEYLPEEEGEHLLTIYVYDASKTLVGKGETLLRVRKPQAPKSAKNILCVGDSLTEGGQWVGEAYRRLTGSGGEPQGLEFENVNFIGNRKAAEAGYEGFGGWRWDSFTSTSFQGMWITSKAHGKTNIDQHSIWKAEDGNLWLMETIRPDAIKLMRVGDHNGELYQGTYLEHIRGAQKTERVFIEEALNETANPFVDRETKTIDFKKYCERLGCGGIDVAYILLGYNGLHHATVPLREFCKKIVADAKQFVDTLRRDYPQVKVKLCGVHGLSTTGGMSQYGAQLPYCDDYGITRFMMDLNLAYQEWADEEGYRDFMEFINISGQFDSEYGLPYAEKPVNVRSKVTERFGTNGLHPNMEGYMQIADAIFRNMVSYLQE